MGETLQPLETNTFDFRQLKALTEDLHGRGAVQKHTRETVVTKKYDVYWARTPDRLMGYDVQLTLNSNEPVDKMKITSQGRDEQMGVLARVWKYSEIEGVPHAICYKLLRGASGKDIWIKQTSDKVSKDTEKGVDYWDLSESYQVLDKVDGKMLSMDLKTFSQAQKQLQSK
ncbi:hypothetical protein IPM62_03950 [Candidatus Woesebacteria bacterium]|nr:MAG: hypothetical protein IPM62_03950 [Candidatus Woesebacteria bacterium]